jgi:hypothetical protein
MRTSKQFQRQTVLSRNVIGGNMSHQTDSRQADLRSVKKWMEMDTCNGDWLRNPREHESEETKAHKLAKLSEQHPLQTL